MVLLPGSKSTISDLQFLKDQGWDIDLKALMRQGARVVGLCGGYQMMGKKVHDPDGLEGNTTSIDGLGLLDIETVLEPKKRRQFQFSDSDQTTTDTAVTGYEIHLGRSDGKDRLRPMIRFDDHRNDGAISPDGQAMGVLYAWAILK